MPKFPRVENDVEGFAFLNVPDWIKYTKEQKKMKQQGKEWAKKGSGAQRLVGLSMRENPREHAQLAAQGSRGVNWSQWADCGALQDTAQRTDCLRWKATKKATRHLPHNVAQAAAMWEPRQEKPKAYMCTTRQGDGTFKWEPCTHEQHTQQKLVAASG